MARAEIKHTTPAAPAGGHLSHARGTVRGKTGRRAPLSEPRLAWYLRKRVVFPLAFIAAVVFTAAYCWWHYPVVNQLTGERKIMGDHLKGMLGSIMDPKQSLNITFPGKREINVLLVGLDHIPPSKIDPGIIRRSDAVMTATTSFDTKQIRVLSLPRDGWVQHWQAGRNRGYERLGNTFSLGQEEGIRQGLGNYAGGIQRITESVSHLLEMPLDYYVIIEFEGLMQLVDALGGLRVDVEMDMDRDDNAGNLHIHLKKGMQLLSGREVVQYARYRDPKLADLGRMPRQQKVLRLLLQKMMKAEHRRKLPELARIMSESVRTNLALDQLVALAQHIDEYSPDCIQTETLDSYYDSDPTMPEIQCQGVPEGDKVGAQRIYARDIQAARGWLKDLAPPPPPAQVVADDTGPVDNDDEQLAGEQ